MPREIAPEGQTSVDRAATEHSDQIAARAARLSRVLEDVVTQRLAGHALADDVLVEQHPDLQPELAARLAELRRVESLVPIAAGSSVSSSDRTLGGMSGGATADGAGPLLAGLLPGYELIREIHRGGQGVVFEAYQKSTKRHVAVKVLFGTALGGVHTRERFLREIEIQAGLTHPNIIAIHDSGMAAGLLYFAMDYIAGEALDVYVAQRWGATAAGARSAIQSSGGRVRGILDLFVAVCDAVNAAHVQGVIHRDLKPTNVRVDATGTPHVLDFGLAKLTVPNDLGSSAAASMTQTGQFVGSLPWAAPEQAGGNSRQIDTRTDVYALGVVFYQLLTGRFPYDVTGPVHEVLRRIMEREPVHPRSLCRGIDYDLDTIVLKCLSKERDRRYQNAGELARDIARYRARQPIEARPAGALYLLGKFVQRHTVLCGTLAALVVVLVGATVISTTQYVRAESARAEATTERDRATMLNDFFKEALANVSPPGERGASTGASPMNELTAKDLFDQAEAEVAKRFSGDPELESDIRGALSRGYLNLRYFGDAEKQAKRCYELRLKALGPDHPKTLMSMRWCVEGCLNQGKCRPMLDFARTMYAADQRILGQRDPETLNAGVIFAFVLAGSDRLAEAERLLRGLAATLRNETNDNPYLLSKVLVALCTTLHIEGDLSDAEAAAREMIRLWQAAPRPESDRNVAEGSRYLGFLLRDQGRYAESQSVFAECVPELRSAFGAKHPDVVSAAAALAEVQTELANRGEPTFAPPETSADSGDGGTVTTVDYAAMERDLRSAASREREIQKTDSRSELEILDRLYVPLSQLGRWEDAEENAQYVVVTAERLFPDGRYSVLPQFRENWGRCLTGLNRFEEAEQQLLKAHDGQLKMRGPEHSYTRACVADLVHLYEQWDKPEEAERWRTAPP